MLSKSTINSPGTLIIDSLFLPRTETYILQVTSNNGNSQGNYSFILYSWKRQLAFNPHIKYEEVISDSIQPAIALKGYTLQGSAGDIISYRMSCKSYLFATVKILDSTGLTLFTRSTINTPGTLILDSLNLPGTGQYIIQIMSNQGNSQGDFSFIVYSRQLLLSNSQLITFDQFVTDTINPAIEMKSYLFQGNTGDLVSFRSSCSGGLFGTIKVLGANGSLITQKSAINSPGTVLIDAFALPRSEVYMIQLMSNNGGSQGFYTFGVTKSQ